MSQSGGFNINQLLGPLMLSAVLKGEDIGPVIDALVDAQINEQILDTLLRSVSIPPDWQPLIDVFRTVSEFDTLKCALAAMRGEQCTPSFTIDKLLNIVIAIQMMNALSGVTGSTSTTSKTS